SWHGNPYVVDGERRDADWVARRIGNRIVAERPDVIEYVKAKLGDDAGAAYLERRYYVLLATDRSGSMIPSMPDQYGFDHLGTARRCIDCGVGGPAWDWPVEARQDHQISHKRATKEVKTKMTNTDNGEKKVPTVRV